MNSLNTFIVSARLTVVPQIARISSGSSSVACAGADKGSTDDAGSDNLSASEEGCLFAERTGAARERVGVRLRAEWISPRRFLGVASPAGLLGIGINKATQSKPDAGNALTRGSQGALNPLLH